MRKRILLGAAAVAAWALPCAAGPVQLQPGVKLQAAGEVIDDHQIGHFVPTVTDFNGDGKKDLIVGAFAGEPGNVRLYLNIGTDAEPKLDRPLFLEANGQPIKLSGG